MQDKNALETVTSRNELRARIVEVSAALLTAGGREALTTRAVAAQAGVQPPTIYRIFGDKKGLLNAVAEYGFATYLQHENSRDFSASPIDAMRAGWDLNTKFGLANPALYSLMYGDPFPQERLPSAEAARLILKEHIGRIAAAGRLRIREAKAVEMMWASGCGTVLALLATPESERDLSLSESLREAAISAITTPSPGAEDSSLAATAITLRAKLHDDTASPFSEAERALLQEWLERLH